MEIKVQGSITKPYIVDTEGITCSCPHFNYRTQYFSIDNQKRLCKHLWKVIDGHPELKPAVISKRETLARSALRDSNGEIRYPIQIFDLYVYDIRILLQHFSIVKKFEFCGDYRRLSPRVDGIDVLMVLEDGSSPEVIFNYCEDIFKYERLLREKKKASYKVDGCIQINFKIVLDASWAFAVCHYTGGKEENIRLRRLANSKGLTLNEYGIFKDEEFIGQEIKTEQDLYSFLGVPYKPPYDR